MARISLRKIELCELALDQLLECSDLSESQRALVSDARTRITTLRPTPASGTHDPVYRDVKGRQCVGCSCGWVPSSPAARASMAYSAYQSHRAKLSLPRSEKEASWDSGPNTGRTLSDLIRAETAARASLGSSS